MLDHSPQTQNIENRLLGSILSDDSPLPSSNQKLTNSPFSSLTQSVNFSSKYSSLSAQDLDYQQHPFIFHHNQMKQNHQSISLDNLDSPPKLSFTIKLKKSLTAEKEKLVTTEDPFSENLTAYFERSLSLTSNIETDSKINKQAPLRSPPENLNLLSSQSPHFKGEVTQNQQRFHNQIFFPSEPFRHERSFFQPQNGAKQLNNNNIGKVNYVTQIFNNNINFINNNNNYNTYSCPMPPPQNLQKHFNKHHQKYPRQGYQNKQDIKVLIKNLATSCKEQVSSKIIQQYLMHADMQEKEKIITKILPHAYNLSLNVFGNFVIQRLFEVANKYQKLKIFNVFRGHIFELSCDMYGCRVVQKFVDELKDNEAAQNDILRELNKDLLFLIKNSEGHHVIIKCLETIPADKFSFLLKVLNTQVNVVEWFFSNAHACKIIQRVLTYSSLEQTKELRKKIMDRAFECCLCQYGNYLVQYFLKKGLQKEKDSLLEIIKENFISFSIDKYGSNVAEKSIVYGGPQFKEEIVELLTQTFENSKIGLVLLMNNPFGNYVVQRLIDCSSESTRKKIYKEIIASGSLYEIKQDHHGKHVFAFLEKQIEE